MCTDRGRRNEGGFSGTARCALNKGAGGTLVPLRALENFSACLLQTMELFRPTRAANDILIVEDDPIIALHFKTMVFGLGTQTDQTVTDMPKSNFPKRSQAHRH
jgi:hypothetical protein